MHFQQNHEVWEYRTLKHQLNQAFKKVKKN